MELFIKYFSLSTALPPDYKEKKTKKVCHNAHK